jgi:hypothetical protein
MRRKVHVPIDDVQAGEEPKGDLRSPSAGQAGVNECNGDLSPTRPTDRANPQLVQMVVEALYAHCPRNLKESISIKGSPSIRLNYSIWCDVYPEGILFGLARTKSAVHASSFANDAVENKNR